MTDAAADRCAPAAQVVGPGGSVLAAGRASPFALDQLGWLHLARVLRVPPLVGVTEIGYWLVARNRRWLERIVVR